jgi:hypothetical protein
MIYAQLKEDGTYERDLPDSNVEFGPNHFQPARTLDADEKTLFRVVQLVKVDTPSFNAVTHTVRRDGAEFVGGQWQMKWAVVALDAATVTANQAKEAERIRRAEIEQSLKADAILAMVAGKSKAEYDSWWAQRTAAQKDKMLQLLFLAHANQAQ